ncbi:MAG: GFA family protein [Actinobacteria bacterium]|nr:MAG: GFA family protein [Actinomycetota bacterium]
MTRGGGCLCGSVRYTVGGPLREILVCHCIECRRWAGHAWAATAARTADLEIGDTADLRWLPSPRSEHGADRGFCVRCGASLFWRVPGWDRVSISAGTLDEPSGLHVAAHIWVEQGADWERPADDVPAYRGGYPPDARPLVWGDGS